jgi:hypothetical protein
MMDDQDVKDALEHIQTVARVFRQRLADDVHPVRGYAIGAIRAIAELALEEPPRFPMDGPK